MPSMHIVQNLKHVIVQWFGIKKHNFDIHRIIFILQLPDGRYGITMVGVYNWKQAGDGDNNS